MNSNVVLFYLMHHQQPSNWIVQGTSNDPLVIRYSNWTIPLMEFTYVQHNTAQFIHGSRLFSGPCPLPTALLTIVRLYSSAFLLCLPPFNHIFRWLMGTLAMSAALLRTTFRYELFVYTHIFMALFFILSFLHSFQSW